VSNLKKFMLYWLPVILWLFVISAASGDKKSFQHSSRIIGPIVHWLFPQLAEAQVNEVVFYVRKSAHMAEFGVMALLCWRAVRQTKCGERRPWSWREAWNALLLVMVFASVDEMHQSFVPSRQGSPWDVVIDCTGAALALWLWWVFGRWRKWW
jgi:VanZ family protein